MKSYKVEVQEVVTYVYDIQAENEEIACYEARAEHVKQVDLGVQHYYETGDSQILQDSIAFDVTGTDDDVFKKTGDELCNCGMSAGFHLIQDNCK